ncbi:FKBP-type peptidyl-prolyl cis-trans isomerase [Candidatus Saccharibacteria bacterium]|nr:FKBP-type peptidyl-prolyl cis-trans isomerase [Candidatus Saccharibacteria bacterium]
MNEKELKTSPKQRIFITLIAVIMLGSMIASYAAIIMNGGSSDSSQISEAKVQEYENAYNEKLEKFKEATKGDFDKFSKYRSEIKAYNETSANEGPVVSRDLVKGDGRKLSETDTDYLAYYIGWCADETIFDSSFDNNTNPTSFAHILDVSVGLIEGWAAGVAGMHINGIREITIPSSLAYGDSMEICGGYNKPIKFIIMAKENKDPLKTLAAELEEAYMKLQYAHYGIDYDTQY